MKLYTNTIAAIVAFYRGCIATYHRVIGATQSDVRILESRLKSLEVAVTTYVQNLKQEVEEKERQMFALESRLTTDLSKHLEAIKHLDATKRESPNVQGERPELLR
jgi:hypothetical protein